MRTPHVRTLIALLFSLHYHLGDTWLQHTTRKVVPSKPSPWCNGQNVWWLNGCIVLWSTCPQPNDDLCQCNVIHMMNAPRTLLFFLTLLLRTLLSMQTQDESTCSADALVLCGLMHVCTCMCIHIIWAWWLRSAL